MIKFSLKSNLLFYFRGTNKEYMNFFKQVLATVVGIIVSSLVLVFFFVIFIAALIQQSSQDTAKPAPANSVLLITLDHSVVEKTEANPLGDINVPYWGTEKSIGLNAIISRIRSAAHDDNIKGIYLQISTVGVGFASLEAIRSALLEFKESEKFILAYSDVYSQKAYYLAAVADKVYLNPKGSLDFRGLSASTMFFKEALDKLGVDVQVIKVGTYKSAVEPFLLNGMSEASREQVSSYVHSIYDSFLQDIASDRNLAIDTLRHIADHYLIRNAEDAVKYKFVDGVMYKDEILDELKTRLALREGKKIPFISLLKYADMPSDNKSSDEVAVLYAYGVIVDGEGTIGQIGGDKIARELRKLRENDKVKAVVLRVNSGGGSALASEIIWREVELTRERKPIMVSMGDYAASGGYYIAAAADSIFAEESTLTGSIGVFGMVPNLKNLMNTKLGIHIEEVNTGQFAGMMSNFSKPLTAEERAVLQAQVNSTYQTFMERVSAGRNLSIAQVDSLGQGRVWTGKQALTLGLVDKIGNTDAAISAAVAKADLTDYKVVEYPAVEDSFLQLLATSKDQIKLWFLQEELGDYSKYLLDVKRVMENSGIQARLPYTVELY